MTQTQKSYESYAKLIPDYDRSSRDPQLITRWADAYIEARRAGDEYEANKYFAAIILKFWDNVQRIYEAVKQTGSDYDDCAQQLAKCVMVALDYAAWREDSPHYKRPTTAKACINQVIASRGAPEIIYEYNLDSKKANVNTLSLDTTISDDEDGKTWADTIEDADALEAEEANRAAIEMVQMLVDHKKIVESIIADVIVTYDCKKEVKEVVDYTDLEGNPVKITKVHHEFWPYKCVKALGELPDDYADYFASKYEIVRDELDAALIMIRKANNQKKYKYLENSRNTMRAIRNVIDMEL